MNYRTDLPGYVTLRVQIGVRTTVTVDVEINVPITDADNLDFDAEFAVGNGDAKIVRTDEANSDDTFADEDNAETLSQAAAEALAEYRATLETP